MLWLMIHRNFVEGVPHAAKIVLALNVCVANKFFGRKVVKDKPYEWIREGVMNFCEGSKFFAWKGDHMLIHSIGEG